MDQETSSSILRRPRVGHEIPRSNALVRAGSCRAHDGRGCSLRLRRQEEAAASTAHATAPAAAAATRPPGGPAAASPSAAMPSPSKVVRHRRAGKFCQQVAATRITPASRAAGRRGTGACLDQAERSAVPGPSRAGVLKSAPSEAIKPDLVTCSAPSTSSTAPSPKRITTSQGRSPSIEAAAGDARSAAARAGRRRLHEEHCGIDTRRQRHRRRLGAGVAAEACALAELSALASPSS